MMFIKYHWKNFITVNAVYLLSRAIIREKTPPNDNTFYRKEGIYHKQIVLFYVHFAIFMYYKRL